MLYTTSLVPVVLTFGRTIVLAVRNHQQDVVGRILGGGVANRYNGRLLPVRTFLRDKIGTQVSGSSGSGANGSASPARRNMEAVVAKLSPSPGNAVGSSGSVTRLLLRKVSFSF